MSKKNDGLTKQQKIILSGIGSYATYKKIPYEQWQADRMIAKQGQPKKVTAFMDYKK